ncbi:TonB-dependent receptor [Draconibacterium sp.]
MVATAQNTVKVFGVVSDAETAELLQSATIKSTSGTQVGAISNVYGYYSLNIPQSESVEIQVSFVGYKTQKFQLKQTTDSMLNIQMVPGIELDEYTVSANKNTYISKIQIGQLALTSEAIKWAPSLAGESNVMTVLKTLPGVSAGREGSSELFVRGGSHDQNLILLDKSPVYNLNHAFGLLSVFNSSALKNVSLYKEGIPSEFGGRLSSVLDVSVREGNRKTYAGDFTISTVAATVTAEGPIVKDKASFLFSARRSWPDILVTGIAAGNQDNMAIGYYFMDVNAKTNFSLLKKHHFYVSYYTGQDKLFAKSETAGQKSKMEQGWRNTIASARYQSVSGNGAFNDAVLYYSSFDEFDANGINLPGKTATQQNRSELNEFGFKTSREFSIGNYFKFKFGADGLLRSIQPPYKVSEENGNSSEIKNTEPVHQKELAAFASTEYSTKRFDIDLGLRTNMFGEQLTSYFSLEPRLSVYYHLTNYFSVKAGAMRNTQSVYAMPKSVQGMPGYTWLPTTGHLKPQSSWQTSTGVNWQKGRINFDAEVYYKWMENIVGNYLYPSNLYQSTQWYDIIDQGKGRAYGLDFLAQYNANDFQINVKYALSKSEHSFPSVLNGLWIPANYDIRHDFSLDGSWIIQENKQKKKWFTGNFALHSGIPISLPTQSIKSMNPVLNEENYQFDFSYLDYYSQPNNARLKLYHRLDFGFHMQKKLSRGHRTWSVGVINVYNRQNPYSIYKDSNGNFKQVVMFPIMPFASFKRSF